MVMLEEASPLHPPLHVLGLKKANHKGFSIFCTKVTFECDHEKPSLCGVSGTSSYTS